jgi:hypothetical protein
MHHQKMQASLNILLKSCSEKIGLRMFNQALHLLLKGQSLGSYTEFTASNTEHIITNKSPLEAHKKRFYKKGIFYISSPSAMSLFSFSSLS